MGGAKSLRNCKGMGLHQLALDRKRSISSKMCFCLYHRQCATDVGKPGESTAGKRVPFFSLWMKSHNWGWAKDAGSAKCARCEGVRGHAVQVDGNSVDSSDPPYGIPLEISHDLLHHHRLSCRLRKPKNSVATTVEFCLAIFHTVPSLH